MAAGAFEVGSRQPAKGVPVWATPEVVTGGFVTGNLLAGGPMLEHEQAILKALELAPDSGRAIINEFFLSVHGLTMLSEWLWNGRYEITVPEEGALLVVVWLMQQDQPDAAAKVLHEISPFFDRLRFYPVPSDKARSSSAEVSVQTTGELVTALNGMSEHKGYMVQREMITVWIPMMDRLVGLVLETVQGEAPDLARGGDGLPVPVNADGRFPVVGGWPLQSIPQRWETRVSELLEDYEVLRRAHQKCAKPDRRDDNFYQLRELLRRALPDIGNLPRRELGLIRLIVARYLAKHGQPGSAQRLRLRREQAQSVALSLHSDLAKVIARRLADFPQDAGLTDTSSLMAPVTPEELPDVVQGSSLPESIVWKVGRARCDTLDNLVSKRVLTSGDSLALVLPKVTAEIHAAEIKDDALRRVQADVYRAFRKRRSLLLLNLESQIRIEELPWVAVIEPWRSKTEDTRQAAVSALRDIASTALTAFPQAILPNRLVREFSGLARQAGLDLPLVEEIASDIFMGEFGPKFLHAAKAAAGELQGTLYHFYYNADFDNVLAMEVPSPETARRSWWNLAMGTSQDPFSQLCWKRAKIDNSKAGHPAANGMVIEQQQILTTQNLSVLIETLNLPVDREAAAIRCWLWIIRRLRQRSGNHHARLIMVKNAAYAWRQMIYFLSGLTQNAQREFLYRAGLFLSFEPNSLQEVLQPLIAGLQRAMKGQCPESPPDSHLLLGWTTGRHWLIGRIIAETERQKTE
ncbi:hypothetical protein [Brevifollis gellanilyticus]|nr:hypothetical protein [Brevifollis gellanilyticus]